MAWVKGEVRLDPINQLKICEPCWNYQHYMQHHEDGKLVKVHNCEMGDCECLCRKIEEEEAARIPKPKNKSGSRHKESPCDRLRNWERIYGKREA